MRKFAGALFLSLIAGPAFASIAGGLNDIREAGCGKRPGVKAELRTSRGLDGVAKEWSKGGRLKEAIARTDYRATNTSSMRVEGTKDEKKILQVLEAQYCNEIVDPAFKEIGVYQKGDVVWVVVAAPFTTPAPRDTAAVAAKVLELVNAARSKPRRCGRTDYKAAPPLQLSAMLNRAALIHSQDMSNKDFFEHEGSDGSHVSERVSRVGYKWQAVAENIAIGAEDADRVVRGWLNSPGHCANIMGAQYTEMGLSFVVDRRRDAGIYWTQVFARPM